MNGYPSISIVTPSFNQGQFLEETINSILDQKYPHLEYIIIDGGSTDHSVEIIKKYCSHIKYWVSEKDSGQAQAINKGLQHCTGEIFNWLNSDDYLQPGALQKIADGFNDPAISLVAGKVNNFSIHESEIVANQHLSAAGLMRWDRGVQFVQPGVWMRLKYFIDCGGVNEQFHYAFDWDMMVRYLSLFPGVKYLDDVLVNFRLHDESKTVSAFDKFTKEEELIIEELNKQPKFKTLHSVCKWKMARAMWTKFLIDTTNAVKSSKTKKIYSIIAHLKDQPADKAITRMTLGAIKKILIS